MPEPKLPEIAKPADNLTQAIEYRVLEMGEIHADAVRDVAKSTYAIPARQETYRYVAALILVGALLYFLIPPFLASKPTSTILALVITAIVAVVSAEPAIKAVANALKGS